jgi:hypothetical protein
MFSLIYDIMQLIVTLMSLLSGQGNGNGWSAVAMFALLAIGSAYYLNVCNKARLKQAV